MKTLANNIIRDIAEATDCNDHNSALAILAYALNNENMIREITMIDDAHMDAGYLTEELYGDREIARRVIMQDAANCFENINEINAAF